MTFDPEQASVGFLRPRLGIGGSERLVTDAAVALSERRHRVTMFVPDRGNAAQFPGLTEAGIHIDRAGGRLPEAMMGRLRAPMAVARTAFAGWHMSRSSERPDVVFCDVVPHVIPFVRRLARVPVLYYCHYPDLLLTREDSRDSIGYRLYRGPVDRLEASGVCAADLVVTNSRFTARVARGAFPELAPSRMRVLYPGVQVSEAVAPRTMSEDEICLLSISRFDPRKNLKLAVDALAALRGRVSGSLFARVRLVLAGHFDVHLPEAIATVEDLRQRATAAGLAGQIDFRFSLTEEERVVFVARSRCVIYTPTAEHFGYVPIEAMAAGRPVVAVNQGGPAETIVDGETGFLCEATPDSFADALACLIASPERATAMGVAGHAHVAARFSLRAFGDGLDALIHELVARRRGLSFNG